MKVFTQIVDGMPETKETVTLSFEYRQKARFKAVSDSGDDMGVQIERGKVLRDGTVLSHPEGDTIMVLAAKETLSSATADDATLFAKICYHLGNRHVPLQIDEQVCKYQHDHVLDEMILGLGGKVELVEDKFEPESGAYSSESSGHSHSHSHSHSHGSHSHSH